MIFVPFIGDEVFYFLIVYIERANSITTKVTFTLHWNEE